MNKLTFKNFFFCTFYELSSLRENGGDILDERGKIKGEREKGMMVDLDCYFHDEAAC